MLPEVTAVGLIYDKKAKEYKYLKYISGCIDLKYVSGCLSKVLKAEILFCLTRFKNSQ